MNSGHMDLIRLNLRGTLFVTSRKTVGNAPSSSPLHALDNTSRRYNSINDEYFFDRNPEIFHQVLDFLSTGKLHIPRHVCTESVREELRYWGIPQGRVEKCCWKSFYQIDSDLSIIKKLSEHLPCPILLKQEESRMAKTGNGRYNKSNIKLRIWKFLNDRDNTLGSKIWSACISFTIVLSIVLYVLVSLPVCRVDRKIHIPFPETKYPTSSKVEMYWHTAIHPAILCVDAACNAVLSVEWFLNLLTCPSKRQFLRSFLNMMDAIACVFIWVFIILDHHREILVVKGSYGIMLFLGTMYSTRVFRVFRIVRHNCGMKILLLALKSSARELGVLALSFGCFAVLFGALIYMAEISSPSFPDILTSVWWSVITMTTVGYGDYYPKSSPGYMVGTVSAVFGILLIALPIAVTSSNFHDFYYFNKYRVRYVNDKLSEENSIYDNNRLDA